MAQSLKVGIVGAGWPGVMHARGYAERSGFKVVAVADLIPARRKAMLKQLDSAREFADGMDLIADRQIDVVSLCVPNDLHEPLMVAALKAKKHVLCESPPALDARQARRMQTAARRAQTTVLYAMQRRFGSAEQAARQAIQKGYLGEVFHVRASWTRTRAIPIGTGWYATKSRSGGGAMMDLGCPMLDLAWFLMGQPTPISVFAVSHRRFGDLAPAGMEYDVEDSGTALFRFEGGKSLELTCSWAINQPPGQNGTVCRLYGQQGALEVYTPHGPTLYRGFEHKGPPKATALKTPKLSGYPALIRHFRDCIEGKSSPAVGPAEGLTLAQMLDAIDRSAATGRSVNILASPQGADEAQAQEA